jgi:hypothetical protein
MISEEQVMSPATQPIAETVILPPACDGSQGSEYCRRASADGQINSLAAPTHGRVLHAAIRIGKSFELVFECRQS